MTFFTAIIDAVKSVVAWAKSSAKAEDDAKKAQNRAEAEREVTAAEEAAREERKP